MVWYFELRIEQTITKRKEQESNQYHERRIRRKNNKDFLGLTRKTCSYLTVTVVKVKNQMAQKNVS